MPELSTEEDQSHTYPETTLGGGCKVVLGNVYNSYHENDSRPSFHLKILSGIFGVILFLAMLLLTTYLFSGKLKHSRTDV